ncbi:TPA: class I SAM-dependent methyltransferase [Candidatus Poribacteria bacterium]|nr:class I SAM-dependent methyltransferase [Candidatus Poribacteria bacterium]
MEEVPLFATEDEERQWWATHDLAPELWEDVTEEQGALLDRLAVETGAQKALRRIRNSFVLIEKSQGAFSPMNQYDEKYNQETYYWGIKPSPICFEVLKMIPPERTIRLIDIGCGEGRNTVFFARNGYVVTAFDLSLKGVEKTKRLAEKVAVDVNVFQADINEYRLSEEFDILFSTGVLHYVPPTLRAEIFENYKQYTTSQGLNVFSVFVKKPFIARAPDGETTAQKWISGELFTHYHDWRIEYCTEEIFDCMSSGAPHQHAVNRVIARKVV